MLVIISHKKSVRPRKKISHPDFIAHYFVGDPDIDTDYLLEEETNTVYLKVPDNYESLPQKVAMAMKFADENYGDEIEGLFKTDDEIELNLDLLSSFVSDNKEHRYFGLKNISKVSDSNYHFGKCESQKLNKTKVKIPACEYCSGGGYYVSKNLLHKIYEQEPRTIFEDVSVGKILNELGVFPKHVPIKAAAFWKSHSSIRMTALFPHCSCGLIRSNELNFCPHCNKRYYTN